MNCYAVGLHSRPFLSKLPELKFSEVWTAIGNGAKAEGKKRGIKTRAFYPRKNYHDPVEYAQAFAEIRKKGKPDAFVLSVPPGSEIEQAIISCADSFNCKFVAINIPPSDTLKKVLGERLIGYVGMNEIGAGQTAAREIISRAGVPEHFVVITDKVLFAYDRRIEGAKSIAKKYGIEVTELRFIDNVPKKIVLPPEMGEKVGIITVGTRSTEIALRSLRPERVSGIVGMDMNEETANAIISKKMIGTLIQHPFEEGALGVRMAATGIQPFTEWYCGPTIVTTDNIQVLG